MDHIGFYLFMIGMAAAGGALDRGDSLIGAIVMTAVGVVLMRLYREESEDEESKEDSGAASGGSGSVDKPSGESGGGCVENTKRGGGRDISNADNSILSWDNNRDGTCAKKRNLRSTEGVDRKDRFGMGIHRL